MYSNGPVQFITKSYNMDWRYNCAFYCTAIDYIDGIK